MNRTNQNDAQRQEKLKQVLRELHEGKSVEEIKAQYGQLLQGINPGYSYPVFFTDSRQNGLRPRDFW